MAKQIADELQNLQYNDPQLHRGFSDAIQGRPATSYDHLLVRLNDRLIDLRHSRDASRTEVARLRDALHQVSLVAQNSAGSKEECGWIARRALEGK